MKIRFMGTGAADFSPRLATEFRYALDKNARCSSSVLIDDTIPIDCGPHVLDAFQIQGISLEQVTDLLITHFHDDHFNRENIEKLTINFLHRTVALIRLAISAWLVMAILARH